MLFQLSLGTLITFSTVPLSEMTRIILIHYHVTITTNICQVKTISFCTCANEHDIILSISSVDSVHSDLRETVVHIGSNKDGPSAHRVDGVVHQRVVARKLDHIIWETLCGLKAAKRLAGTLVWERKNEVRCLDFKTVMLLS